MALTSGDFSDPEGLTYVGSDQFVLVEEREREAHLFTYIADGTLSQSDVQSVKLGTTVGNVGLEGSSHDPETGGYILVKETSPQGIFQTEIDFGAGTSSTPASRSSPAGTYNVKRVVPNGLYVTTAAQIVNLSEGELEFDVLIGTAKA